MNDACNTTIETRDGHQLQGYLVQPECQAIGGLVILHEIFGITDNMKQLAHQYAGQGYRVVVPALFDRVETGLVIPYEQTTRGRDIAERCKPDQVLIDIEAATQVASDRQAAVIGFCWGGTYAYLAACGLGITCAVSYYGTRIHENLHKKPKHPIQFHFGEQDLLLPKSTLRKIRKANPCQSFYLYPQAGHGFANAARSNYHAQSAEAAYNRTLAFLARLFNTVTNQQHLH